MIEDESSAVESGSAEAGLAAPPARTRRDDMREIATGTTTFIANEPSYLGSVYRALGYIDQKFTLAGYDHGIDETERRMLKAELFNQICKVFPMGSGDSRETFLARWDEVAEVMADVNEIDVPLQVPRLVAELAYWIDKTRFGLPERAPTEMLEVDDKALFAKATRRLEEHRVKGYLQP